MAPDGRRAISGPHCGPQGGATVARDGRNLPGSITGKCGRERHARPHLESGGFRGSPGTYEYEMSAKVDSYVNDKLYLPTNAMPYTRQDLKSVLLRRPYYEQIPILRCSSHRAAGPKEFSGDKVVFRNFTVRGNVYWSGLIWEQCWLDEVPVGSRGTIVMFGAQGPPFSSERRRPCLRRWISENGAVPWARRLGGGVSRCLRKSQTPNGSRFESAISARSWPGYAD